MNTNVFGKKNNVYLKIPSPRRSNDNHRVHFYCIGTCIIYIDTHYVYKYKNKSWTTDLFALMEESKTVLTRKCVHIYDK